MIIHDLDRHIEYERDIEHCGPHNRAEAESRGMNWDDWSDEDDEEEEIELKKIYQAVAVIRNGTTAKAENKEHETLAAAKAILNGLHITKSTKESPYDIIRFEVRSRYVSPWETETIIWK